MAQYGASPDAWRHFSKTLGLTAHLLPVVSNPNAVIAARSKLRALGKVPSVYDREGEAVGLGDWTERHSSQDAVDYWASHADYGICIQSRAIRAIDVDIPDQAKADSVERAIVTLLDGIALPKRYRSNSGKRLFGFRLDMPFPKRVIPVDGGIIEFLGDGQQFIASGQHDSGVPYLWDHASGLPSDFPPLTPEQVETLWSSFVMLFATGEPKIAREKRIREAFSGDVANDERGQWLADNWDVYDTGRSGELYLRCPFSDEHSSDSGETSTAYFLAGTGGYERGHWVCLHAHCMGRTDGDFDHACGYIASGFSALPDQVAEPRAERPVSFEKDRPGLAIPGDYEAPLPPLVRDTGGKIEPTADNLQKLMSRPDVVMMHLAFDSFRDEIMWSPFGRDAGDEQWLTFTDDDYVRIRIMLERRAVKSVGQEMLRSCVLFVAKQHAIDSAKTWLVRLQWDGVPRVERFMLDYMAARDDNRGYARAVGRYLWTALAGRVLQPGVQADMAPVFYGPQGARKTSAIKAMVPHEDHYTDIDLKSPDENLSRRLRGKLIGELEELRGLHSRDADTIKAWITRTHEEWIPKFKEFGTKFARRLLLIGTTNLIEFLGDDTGERRWLPAEVGITGKIDVEGIARDREQLWAEAAARFLIGGIEYRDAEELAKAEHGRYKIADAWHDRIEQWLHEPNMVQVRPVDLAVADGEGISSADILVSAIGIGLGQVDHGKKMRISRVMKALGFEQRQHGTARERKWFRIGE